MIASDSELPLGGLRAAIAAGSSGDEVVADERLRRFASDADILTDDFAPADQLLTRGP